MSKLFFIAGLLLISLYAAADNFYSQTIYAQSIDDKEYRESVRDLSTYLSRITGKNFSVKYGNSSSGDGIFVLLNQKGLLNESLDQKIQGGSAQAFVLSGNNDRLLIVADHPSGLSRGIYTYLDWLGIKWYFPGEKWEKLVTRSSILYTATDYETPAMLYRNFFGTGGIRQVTPIDRDERIRTEWEIWKRRNRIGSEYDVAGHYGDLFNITHRKELERHPEYLALVKGKREWIDIGKWCVSNPGFRELFIADRVNELKQDLASKTYPYKQIVLSVEPSDGGGDCECEACKKLGTVSERYYYLANEVAKAFEKISPRASVSLYAYNTHVAPPSFSLRPNVIVVVIPYAFQDYGAPEKLLNDWTKRHNNLLIYDYYCIPDWHYEVPYPRKTSSDTLAERIRFWQRNKIKGFQLESVYGTALAGPGLYTAARIGWDSKANSNEISRAFYTDMFGPASAEAARFFQYLKTDFVDATSLPYLRSLLLTAKSKASGDVAKRITDLEAYVHYLSLYYQWQSAKNRAKAWEELVQFTWEIYPSMMIHSTRIADLFFYQLKENDPLAKDWNIIEPYGRKLQKLRPASDEKIRELTADDNKKAPLLEGFTYTRSKVPDYSIRAERKINPADEIRIRGGSFPEAYVKASPAGTINFSMKSNDESLPPFKVLVKLIDTASKQAVYTKTVEVSAQKKDVSISINKGKIYKLVLEYAPWLVLKFPAEQWIAFKEIPTYGVLGTLWFYVPPRTSYIYFSNAEAEQPVFKNSEGKVISPEKVNELNMYRLRSDSKEGWWSMGSSQYKILKFYSVPDLFFTHPGYTVSSQ